MSLITDILRKPSIRTQMESSMTGITIMMIGSLSLVIYLIASNTIHGFWYIFLLSLSELGILSFQFSLISTTYSTYRQYKLEMNMYPKSYKLKIKTEEAKALIKELDLLTKQIEEKKYVKEE